MPRRNVTWIVVLSWLLLLTPPAVYAWVFGRYAINIPKWDDHVLKAFLLQYEQATTLGGKLQALVRQHNEHRIILDRLATWLDYQLFGKLDYTHLMILGNLSLLGLLGVFIRALRSRGAPVWTALPVSLLLFNLCQWENMFWGMAALQNFAVVVFILATLYQLAFHPEQRVWAYLLAIAASGTSGNGLLVWPVGLLVLLARRDFRTSLAWTLAGAVSFGLYFWGYAKPPGNPPPPTGVGAILQGWLAFNGSAADALPLLPPYAACTALGAILTLAAAGLTIRFGWHYFRRRPLSSWQLFTLGALAFLVGTGLVVAQGRVGFGRDTLITSRYKIYSLTLLALLLSYAIVHVPVPRRRLVTGVAALGAGLIAFFSYTTFLDETIGLRKYLVTSQFNWTYTRNEAVSTIDDTTRRYLDNAPAFYDRMLEELYRQPASGPGLRLDTLYQQGAAFILRQDSLPPLGLRDEGAYFLARSDRRLYLFAARQRPSHSRKAWFKPSLLFGPGVNAQLDEADLAKGEYALYLLTVTADGQYLIRPTPHRIHSEGPSQHQLQTNW